MKRLVTLVLVYMLFSEAFQASAALKCYSCLGSICISTPCTASQVHCYHKKAFSFGLTVKGCAAKDACNSTQAAWNTTCCQTDLCNSAEGVKLSLLFMLVPLISSILFI